MKILYIHGFGSAFDPTHEKVKLLETLGTVYGVDVDYCKGFDHSFETVRHAVTVNEIDLLVGTSMGGYMSACVGAELGIPFVALNPAVEPSKSLLRWIGAFTSYIGKEQYLSENTAASYPDIAKDGCGLVIVESADEVIDPTHTETVLRDVYRVERFMGGSHRFTHTERALPLIKEFYNQAAASYGSDNI